MNKKMFEVFKSYILSFFLRLLGTTFLLFLALSFKTNIDVKNYMLSQNISLLKIPFLVTKLLPIENKISDVMVVKEHSFDEVNYVFGVNEVINYSSDAVYNFVDGLIIKITKNNYLYSVLIQSSEGVLYEYKNLKSVDFGIYTFVESQTIIGASVYDDENAYFKYDLTITKNGKKYGFYEIQEG